jgi:hypothetical protein
VCSSDLGLNRENSTLLERIGAAEAATGCFEVALALALRGTETL